MSLSILAACALVSAAAGPAKQAKALAGGWVEQSVEANGERSDLGAKTWPAAVVVEGNTFRFEQGTLASALSETGTFTVVGVAADHIKVDVKATVRLSTDLGRTA